jgi:DNA invertase Pin-like site-specific DNA recombinase
LCPLLLVHLEESASREMIHAFCAQIYANDVSFETRRMERVKAGLRNAGAKGKQLGRPKKKILDTKRIATLRAKGVGWKHIAANLGVGVGTIYSVVLDGSKIRKKVF